MKVQLNPSITANNKPFLKKAKSQNFTPNMGQTFDTFENTNKSTSNPSFKATFWKHLTAGVTAGASLGSAFGAKTGAVVDIGTGGATLGASTITGSTLGGLIGGAAGGVGGTISYFACKNSEKAKKEAEEAQKKLEKEKEELEKKSKALAEQQAAADRKNTDSIKKQQDKIDELKKQNEILQKFATKELNVIKGVGLGKIAGYEEDKEALNMAFISPYKKSFMPEHQNEALNIPNGILLYGISGNGKTTLAQGIIEELVNTTPTDFHDLSNIKRSNLEEELDKIKTQAQQNFENENKRTIIFLDEFDGFAPDLRTLQKKIYGDDKENPTNSYLKSFMNDCADYGITIIAATNYPQKIEKPFIDNNKRFSIRTAIEAPDAENIKAILNYYLSDVTDDSVNLEEVTDVLAQKLDTDSALFSCSKIEELAKKAKDSAKKEKRLVSQEDLLKQANRIKPNIKEDDITDFKEDFEFIANMTYEEYLEEKEENRHRNEE